MKSPTNTTRTLLATIVASSTFLDFWSYSQQYYKDATAFTSVLDGTAAAPAQYRVGVLKTADFLARHGHLGIRHTLALLDGLSAALAVFLLYSLLRRSTAYRVASRELRWYGSAACVVLVQFYLAWLIWYQRPETLPTAALVTLVLWLLTRGFQSALSGIGGYCATGAALVLLAAAQGLVRADVAVCLHVGVALMCLLGWRRTGDSVPGTDSGWGLALPRMPQLLTSGLCILVAGGMQYTMMHIVYPHASYGDTPVVQLKLNFSSPLRLIPFFAFLLPYGWTLWQVARRPFARDTWADRMPSLALLAGSVLYLGIWSVMGKIDEVRIFLPFALALAPLTVQLSMQGIERSATAAPDGR